MHLALHYGIMMTPVLVHNAVGRSSPSPVLHPEKIALLRHELPAFQHDDKAPGRRPRQETTITVPGDREASRARRTSARPGEMEVRQSERMLAEIEGIRDRVTISTWGDARTSTRYETYDRHGNLSSIATSPEPMEPAVFVQAARCEVTFVLVPYPVPVMRYVDPEPAGTLAWSPVNALPEPV